MEKAGEYALKKCIENQQFHVIDEDKSIGLSRVSVNGSWNSRHHLFLNRVLTACYDGKYLDFHVMSKHCSLCSLNKKSIVN